MRKIRISVEIYDHHPGITYDELPEGWEEWDEGLKALYLNQVAADRLAEAAGSGATVVEVDEQGNEVPEP